MKIYHPYETRSRKTLFHFSFFAAIVYYTVLTELKISDVLENCDFEISGFLQDEDVVTDRSIHTDGSYFQYQHSISLTAFPYHTYSPDLKTPNCYVWSMLKKATYISFEKIDQTILNVLGFINK